MTKLGSGTLTLGSQNTYWSNGHQWGTINVSKLTIHAAPGRQRHRRYCLGALVLNGGTLQYTGAGDTTDHNMTIGPGGATLDASGTGAITFINTTALAYSATNTAASLTFTGTGTGIFNNGIGNNGSGITTITKNGEAPGLWVLVSATPHRRHHGQRRHPRGYECHRFRDRHNTVTIGALGALQIGNGGTTGSVSGTIVDNGALIYDRSDTITYSASTTASGSLVETGSGTLISTGTTNFAGGTSITAGTLQLGSGGTTGSVTGTINDNGSLVLDQSGSFTFLKSTVPAASLRKAASIVTLSASNGYQGGTTNTAGEINFSSLAKPAAAPSRSTAAACDVGHQHNTRYFEPPEFHRHQRRYI